MPIDNFYFASSTREIDQQKIWASIRVMKEFTNTTLAAESETNVDACRNYTRCLRNAGYLELTGEIKRGRQPAMRIIKDCGINAPRVRRDGSHIKVSKNQKIWQAMKVLKRFSYDDLLISIQGTTRETLKSYLRYLAHAGYLKKINKTHYCLISSKCVGVKAPVIKRTKVVYDPNIDQVVWPVQEVR